MPIPAAAHWEILPERLMKQHSQYESLLGIPPLAGLCSMSRAVDGAWSLEESLGRLKRLHYVLKRLHEMLTAKITAEPIYELKTAFSYHAYLCAEQVSLLRRRVGEMREPPLGLESIPHTALERLMNEVECSPTTADLIASVYTVVVPKVIVACDRIQSDAHPLADAPTVRVARLIKFEISEMVDFGNQALKQLDEANSAAQRQPWMDYLKTCLDAAGQLDGVEAADGQTPAPWHSITPYQYDKEPRRDERFRDSYNAGVNPEAFLYDEKFSAQDKTLMMYYKRIRELDVPEMMASILVDLRHEEPWEFHMEMSRQLWDESRHAMMGEVGFVSLGLDWRQIPINFTWSRNLNLQLDARQRHGVLFFIEQNLMPRTGKRYEWEVANESGDPLSAVFQDFDWADEVLHAQIGRRWYVPRYESLKEALGYGDACWSKVLSHWQSYCDAGLTEHRNWWPELYSQACLIWGKDPDPQALMFCETYQDKRADLEKFK